MRPINKLEREFMGAAGSVDERGAWKRNARKEIRGFAQVALPKPNQAPLCDCVSVAPTKSFHSPFPSFPEALRSVDESTRSRMDRWCGKVAVVTGASSGIGEAIALALVEAGMRVVGMARRLDRMQKIAKGLTKTKGSFYPLRADVTREEDILEAFGFAETMGGVDVLVNNAGVVFPETIIDGTTDKFRNVLDVNVLCTAICIREATRSMRKHGVEGHIINVNSIVGHDANKGNAPLSLYQASKYAVTAISEVVRNELAVVKAPIRVTNLSPGVVNTDMVRFASRNERIFDVLPYIETKDVANSVLYALGTPANVQVTELTVTTLH